MSIDAIAGMLAGTSTGAAVPLAGIADASRSNAVAGTGRLDFMDAIGSGLARADRSLQTADTQLRALSAGQDIPIHDVMISMEQARLDLMLVVEVRNRLVESYQEMMRMQL